MTEGRDGKQVVGDVQDGDSKFAIQPDKELQNFRLGDDIECAGRLIRDQKSGAVQDRHGDEHSLRLPHAELRGITPEERRLGGQTDARQRFEDRTANRVARPIRVRAPSLFQLRADPKRGVERGKRALQH